MTSPAPLSDAARPSALPNADQVLPSGHRLDGYELHGLIAASGSSLSYLATDLELGLAVVLMEYFPAALARRDGTGFVACVEDLHAAAYQSGLAAFVDEARMLARCQHGALVQVIRLWQARGTVYRAMPYRGGQTLLDLRRDMPGPPDEASLLALLDDLLGALDAFHRTGRTHGGIHPGNILLLGDDRPLLLGPDWAAATLALELGRHTESLAGFAPPEQQGTPPGTPQNPAFDLFALSEVVRFCISGEMPQSLPARRSGEPREVTAALIERCVASDVRQRYSLPLLHTLDAATSGRPHDRPAGVAQYRAWLLGGPPAERQAVKETVATTPANARPDDADAFLSPEFLAQLRRANTVPPPRESLPPVRPEGRDTVPQARRAPARQVAALAALGVLVALGAGLWQVKRIEAPTAGLPPFTDAAVSSAARSTDAKAEGDATAARHARIEADLRRAEELLARSAPAEADVDNPVDPLPEEPTAAGPASAPAQAAVASQPGSSAARRSAETPRSSCGKRSDFALYRCVQTQCAKPRWKAHSQCLALKASEAPR
ncbi:hypothetical protein OOZ63_02830 [Paucibacter sp. PLA-PC-4]|uniref:hypothetical protein n=1 Tax=Paucibacter sp. PLA-PC-4 TaxID=2993655 RepID=UPI0022490BF0|nr:hypothetical protein [Paucibacter sp. PLA-PC-4]MCX2860768.1 hypothetical protein [Paucibacter sp. PLA-PC-4]